MSALRRWRFRLQAAFAAVVILLAVAFAALQFALMPWLARHPQDVSQFLSARLQRPVTIDSIQAVREQNGPLLVLDGVHIGSGKPGQPPLTIPQAELKINFFAWLHRNQSWNEFRVTGLSLTLLRDRTGHWLLRGLDTGVNEDNNDNGDGGNALFDLGSLVLRNLTLRIEDDVAQRELAFASDEVRLINRGDLHRVLARVRCTEAPQAPPLDVAADYDSAGGRTEVYFGGRALDLAAILHRYPIAGVVVEHASGQAQVWTWWQGAQLTQARAEIDLAAIVLSGTTPIVLDNQREIEPRVGFDRLAFGARWERDGQGWRADVMDLLTVHQGEVSPAAGMHLEKTVALAPVPALPSAAGAPNDDGSAPVAPEAAPDGGSPAQVNTPALPATYALRAHDVELATPANVAMLSDALAAELRRWLYQADPVGAVRAATMRATGAQDFDLQLQLDGIAWHPVDKVPGASGVSGRVRGDEHALAITLPPHAAFGVDSPRVFRQPLEFSEFSGDVVAYRTDAPLGDADAAGDPLLAAPLAHPGWRIETDRLVFEGARYGGELRGAIELHDDGAKPLLEAYATVTHADVPASHLFWPSTIPPSTVTFLDRALESGRVAAGRAVFRGELADWPFRNAAGRFEARAETEDVRFQFLPDWPAAERLNAVATFLNTGLHVDTSSAQSANVKVSHAVADIPDLGEPVLDLNVSAAAAGKDLLAYLKATPLGQKFGTHLLGVDIGGDGKVDVHLHLPVKHGDQLDLSGSAVLSDADLADAKYNIRLNKANGKVNFSQRGFATERLAVTMDGKPAEFSLAIGGMTSDTKHAVEASLRATLAAGDVLAYAPVLLAYADRVTGSAQWKAGFVADSDTVKNPTQRLTLESDLRGVALDLPEPLHKNAADNLPLSLALGLPFGGGSLDLHLGDWLHLRGRLPNAAQPFAARVDLGAPSDAAPPAAGFFFAGSTPRLDVTGWLDFALNASVAAAAGAQRLRFKNDGAGVLAGIDLETQSLSAYERDFGAAKFKLTPGAGGLDIAFAGANIDGSLRVPMAELRQRGITAQFARLYWPSTAENADGDTPPTPSTFNPAALPPLHVHIADCRLGEANFGDTTIESYPIADGTHFEQVATHSDNLEMRAHGDWTGRPGSDSSHFAIDFTARNLGHMLDAFGYAGVVDGGGTVAHIEGSWRGAPSAFALATLDGTLKVSVQQGRIPEANTGAGRIFGLFNLGALPRRLTLDFGDLFKSGFSFDSINGLFTLKNGNASTADLEVKGPTADIRVSGRTGLKGKDYDQTMDVTPHVGGTLAVGGALVGGPVGAAAGALLQGIFHNQINQATRIRYSVTGSWDKPVITQLSRETVKPAPGKEKKG